MAETLVDAATPVVTVRNALAPEDEAKIRKRLAEMTSSMGRSIVTDSAVTLESAMAGVLDIVLVTVVDIRSRLRMVAPARATAALTRICADLTDASDTLRGEG